MCWAGGAISSSAGFNIFGTELIYRLRSALSRLVELVS